jgi:hypothetical protein
MDNFIGKTIFNNLHTDKILNQYRMFSQINTGSVNAYFFGFILIYSLTKGNAQALYILCEILEKYLDDEVIKDFYGKLFKYKIVGKRLVDVYENECDCEVHILMDIDLANFTDDYFIEKCKM